MNMLVCVKQVPDTTEIRIDPVTNTLIRDGVPSIVNTFDAYALEVAARVKDACGGKVVALSMGPAQAKNALTECLGVGADKAYLVSDRVCGGSDTLATSYILSETIAAIEKIEGKFDIIFCGKQAIDGDTAQVGPELAENLDIPQTTYAVEVTASEDGKVIVKREENDGFTIVEMQTPCLVTVTKPAFEPRIPTIKSKIRAKRAVIDTLTSKEITFNLERCGLKGSPTKVKKTFTPPVKSGGSKIEAETPAEAAKALVNILADAKVI